MVLVAADPVEAERLGVLELVEILVIDVVALARIVERAGDVDPDGAMLCPEIVRQIRPRHQVEPGELHGRLPAMGSRLLETRRQPAGTPPGQHSLSAPPTASRLKHRVTKRHSADPPPALVLLRGRHRAATASRRGHRSTGRGSPPWWTRW